MPVYDYLCTACDHRADILHGINDPGPNFCPSCGAEGSMRKQFGAPAIHFKGTGWAKKDRGGSSRGTRTASGSSSGDEGRGPKDSRDPEPGTKSAGEGSSSTESAAKPDAAKPDSSKSSGTND